MITEPMKRFLKELFNPSLKCERVGHNEQESKIKIRKKPTGSLSFLSVVEDYYRHTYKCKRCGIETKPEHDEYLTGYNSCTMPTRMWDEMRDNGFTILG